ncbi:MAG: DUF4340 domain-containing protein [Bacteroidales bacterium]|nr:DUF4340 domain-containing protein [Bacteroidales bacterium]
MKKRKNLLIIAIVVVIGIAALVVAKLGSRDATFKQNFHIEDIDNITKIYLADKEDNHVLLSRVDTPSPDTTWLVDELYPASQGMIDILLETLHDMRIRQQVNKNAVPQAIKLLSGRAIKVEVYQRRYFINWFDGKFRLFPHEKLTVTYFVGHETQDMMACHMFRKGDKVPYIIHIPGFRGYLTPRFSADSWAWRSHTIVHWDIRQLQSVSLDIPAAPEDSYTIKRDGDGFAFFQGKQQIHTFDTARVAQTLSCFANLNFDEFAKKVPNTDLVNSFKSAPKAVLHITNRDGVTREVKTYLKYNNPTDTLVMHGNEDLVDMFDLNRLYAVIDSKDTVLIQYFIFDNILQPASFFLGNPMSSFAKE